MTASPSSRPRPHRRPAVRRWAVRAHAGLVAVAVLALLVSWFAGGPDANIGAGLALLLVLVLGLPWSLPLLLAPDAVARPWPPGDRPGDGPRRHRRRGDRPASARVSNAVALGLSGSAV